jgi:hypothetical protein
MVDEISIFATFYILAQAIERILEPLSELPPFSDGKIKIDDSERKIKDYQNIIDKQTQTFPSYDVVKATIDKCEIVIKTEEDAISVLKSNRMFGLWLIASIFGVILCWVFKIGFLETIGATIPYTWTWLDYLVSGIVIGSGTKPLHDIIAIIEKAS